MRNAEKDAIMMKNRRETSRRSAFELFSERSIESVSLIEVADRAGSGIATLYKYFLTKPELAIEAAAAQGRSFCTEMEEEYPLEACSQLSAARLLAAFMDGIIRLYEQNPALLRFAGNFESYVRHEQVPEDRLADYQASLQPVAERFHFLYGRAKEDGTVRTDLPEDELFLSTAYAFFSAAVRQSEGISPVGGMKADPERVILNQKEMILRWALTEQGMKEING